MKKKFLQKLSLIGILSYSMILFLTTQAYAQPAEIDLTQNGTSYAVGSSYNFGSVTIGGSSAQISFYIKNLGVNPLNLTNPPLYVTIAGTNAGDFAVNPIPLTTPVLGSDSTFFSITYNPSFYGNASAIVTILNDDSDEGTYTLNISGFGNPVPPSISPTESFSISATAQIGDIVGNVNAIQGTAAITNYYIYPCSTCYATGIFAFDAVGNIIVNDNSTFTPGMSMDLSIGIMDGNDLMAYSMVTISLANLKDPYLYLDAPIPSVTYGDQPFYISASSHNNSTGAVTYSLMTASSVASIDPTTGLVTILSAGTVSFNVAIASDATHNYDSFQISVTIGQAPLSLNFKDQGNELSGGAFPLLFSSYPSLPTNYDGTISYSIIAGGVDGNGNAVFSLDPVTGIVTPAFLGSAVVQISASGSSNYVDATAIATITIYSQKLPPIANNDTIRIDVGVLTPIKIKLDSNDFGRTGALTYTIDLQPNYPGIQTTYSDPALGKFSVDTSGWLTYIPFEALIGGGTANYTIFDNDGLESNIASIIIKVKSPVEPALIANQIMTPNGDGQNDALVIGYINPSKKSKFYILDENGNEVFYTEDYKNDWSGTDKNKNKLTSGTYYYIYKEFDTDGKEQRVYKNFCQILN